MSSMKDRLCDFGLVRPDWNEARQASVFAGIEKTKRRRALTRALASGLCVVAGGVALLLATRTPDSESSLEQTAQSARAHAPTAMTAPDETQPPITMRDGSTATPLDSGSQLVVETMTAPLIAIRILDGGGRFQVVPDSARVFEVRLNEVTVTVMGTEFEVRAAGETALVSVLAGGVRVTGPGGEDELLAGEARHYSRWAKAEAPPIPEAEPIAEHGPSGNAKPTSGWRARATRGDFEGASSLLLQGSDVRDTVEDLLLAADAMRRSQKPAEALKYLDRIVQGHPSDPRASLAEFTRGRILLHQLNRPKEAASAFATARRLAPRSALAQDALAREVEALHRSGDAARAKARAEEYVSIYPDGRRLNAVRKFGNLGP